MSRNPNKKIESSISENEFFTSSLWGYGTTESETRGVITSDLLVLSGNQIALSKKRGYTVTLEFPRSDDLAKSSVLKEVASQIQSRGQIEQIMRSYRYKNLCRTLDNLEEECEEEGFEPFSEIARENTRKILNVVHKNFPDYEYHIYPTEEREIAIDCTPYKGRGVLILCDSNGSVAYFATIENKNSRFRCDSIDDFPDDTLLKTIGKIDRPRSYTLTKEIKKPISSFIKNMEKDSIILSHKNISYSFPKKHQSYAS